MTKKEIMKLAEATYPSSTITTEENTITMAGLRVGFYDGYVTADQETAKLREEMEKIIYTIEQEYSLPLLKVERIKIIATQALKDNV